MKRNQEAKERVAKHIKETIEITDHAIQETEKSLQIEEIAMETEVSEKLFDLLEKFQEAKIKAEEIAASLK